MLERTQELGWVIGSSDNPCPDEQLIDEMRAARSKEPQITDFYVNAAIYTHIYTFYWS